LHRAELFEAWLDARKLAAWMRPFDTQRADAKLDPRVGGESYAEVRTTG
jgi:uncharacterized protein YndB with AHSA1/START domain